MSDDDHDGIIRGIPPPDPSKPVHEALDLTSPIGMAAVHLWSRLCLMGDRIVPGCADSQDHVIDYLFHCLTLLYNQRTVDMAQCTLKIRSKDILADRIVADFSFTNRKDLDDGEKVPKPGCFNLTIRVDETFYAFQYDIPRDGPTAFGKDWEKYKPMVLKTINHDPDGAPPMLTSQCNICGVKGKLLSCSKCRLARYCSKECQMKGWPKHKAVCKSIIRRKNEIESSPGPC
jgi:hypothetical protein